MLTAFLVEVGGGASVRLAANGFHVATYPLTPADGDGPCPAAEKVLAANGWRITDDWEQVSGGITGGEWIAHAEQADGAEAEKLRAELDQVRRDLAANEGAEDWRAGLAEGRLAALAPVRDELRDHIANLSDKQPWDNRAMLDRVLAALETATVSADKKA